ncbi:hypothetical protein [Actinoplanes sp. NPDC049118]|uniref:hypothetical protein n=1 Tax=Actinoplanes sp. NPDC049118 TaxID=3155769 RepID=UPI0033C7BDC0
MIDEETTDPFAERLVATLQRRAETVDGPRFGAADVVRTGHRTLRRRRAAAGAAVMAVVGAVLATSLLLPGRQPHTPALRNPAPAGVDLLSGNTVHRADGTRVTLGLPAGMTASKVIRVGSGWVAEVDSVDWFQVWFVPDSGAPRSAGRVFGDLGVSPDGRVLVVAHDSVRVVAYELPSLRQIGERSFDDGMAPVVLGVTPDVALLKGAQGDGTPSKAAVWNFRTGSLRTTARDVQTWGVSDDAKVLRQVGNCVDVVPVTDDLPVSRTGWCGKAGSAPIVGGQLSPDGRWASLELGPPDGPGAEPTTVLVRTDDLRAGRWRPVPTGGPAEFDGLSWVGGDTMVLRVPAGGLLRCEAGDRCEALVVPPGVADPQVVVARGAA